MMIKKQNVDAFLARALSQKMTFSIVKESLRGIWVIVVLTLILSVVYPMVITGLSHVLFPFEANGSLLMRRGNVVGSELIGQDFSKMPLFQSRPSATPDVAYNALASGGSNRSIASPELRQAIESRSAFWRARVSDSTKIPADLLTSSASGLDPHITVAAAKYQIERVSRMTGLASTTLERLIQENKESGLFGRHHFVNVLKLNIAVLSAIKTSHLPKNS